MGLQTSTALNANITSLIKSLTNTMEKQDRDIMDIAKVQKSVCEQFGIYLPDDFDTQGDGSLNSFIEVLTTDNKGRVKRVDAYEQYKKFCKLQRVPSNSKGWFLKNMRYTGRFKEIKTNGYDNFVLIRKG